MTRRCGTCLHLDVPVVDGVRVFEDARVYPCTAPIPARVRMAVGQWPMFPNEGTTCPAWQALGEARDANPR